MHIHTNRDTVEIEIGKYKAPAASGGTAKTSKGSAAVAAAQEPGSIYASLIYLSISISI